MIMCFLLEVIIVYKYCPRVWKDEKWWCLVLALQSLGLWLWSWSWWTQGCLWGRDCVPLPGECFISPLERDSPCAASVLSLSSAVAFPCLLLVFKTKPKYRFPVLCVRKHQQKLVLWTSEYLVIAREQILMFFHLVVCKEHWCCAVLPRFKMLPYWPSYYFLAVISEFLYWGHTARLTCCIPKYVFYKVLAIISDHFSLMH